MLRHNRQFRLAIADATLADIEPVDLREFGHVAKRSGVRTARSPFHQASRQIFTGETLKT